MAGSLSPRTLDEEVILTAASGISSASKFRAFMVLEDSTEPVQSVEVYELIRTDGTSPADQGFSKLEKSSVIDVKFVQTKP